MKSPPTFNDDGDDIFGPPRTYATGYCPPKNRPSMISAKYRQKEERRKMLKISVNKLKKIEDPEASLCRSVLINNTVRRLQREVREEKQQKHNQLTTVTYPRCYDDESLDYIGVLGSGHNNNNKETIDNRFAEDDLIYGNPHESAKKFFEEDMNSSSAPVTNNGGTIDFGSALLGANNTNNVPLSSELDNNNKKRSYDDIEDCDVQDVLSQFYMPPTPRMLTSIDEDEDVNVVDAEDDCLQPAAKKLKTINDELIINNNNSISASAALSAAASTPSTTPTTTPTPAANTNNYTCGQASLFSEIQNHVFHSFIASLET